MDWLDRTTVPVWAILAALVILPAAGAVIRTLWRRYRRWR